MAVHLSIGRIGSVLLAVPLAVPLVALVGLAVVAGAVYLPINPGPQAEPGLRVETAPGPGSASVAPQPSGDGRHGAEARADSRAATEAGHHAGPASAVAESVSGTRKAPAAGETETARIATAGVLDADPADAGPAAGTGENRAGPTGPQAAASQPLDRISNDRTHIAGSIDPVTPVTIDKAEQIHAVEGTADGDSNQPRSARAPREQVAVARRVVEPRDLVAPRNLAEPRNPVEPGSRPENMARPRNMAPIPVRAPRRADTGTTARSARTLFERGAKIKLKANKDAIVYITSRNIPDNDHLLEAYSADETAKGIGHAAPGLLDIATQTYRTQASAGTANKNYSLADAMRDAVWRKKTAAKLKTLMTARNTCPEAEEDLGASKPSIGLGTIC